jgi:hypothetical protein
MVLSHLTYIIPQFSGNVKSFCQGQDKRKAKEKRRKKAKTGAKWDVMKKGQCYSKVMEKKDET